MSTSVTPIFPLSHATVAVLGRPNVGKSTLFNVLAEGEKALVHNTAGTTRDVRRTPGRLFDLAFTLVDTAGIEEGKRGGAPKNTHGGHARAAEVGHVTDALQAELNTLAKKAAQQADILLLLIDGGTGLLPADRMLAQFARKLSKPVLVLLNKADLKTAESYANEIETLGFGAPILISAAHNQGMDDLHQALSEYILPTEDDPLEIEDMELFIEDDEADKNAENISEAKDDVPPEAPRAANPFVMPATLRVAVLGRPNVGKSTLVNAFLKEERMLSGPIAGLTREAISHPFVGQVKDKDGHLTQQNFVLVDTPGLRKKANVQEELEQLSVGQALIAANKAHITILVVDVATYSTDTGTWELFEQQDARIANAILNAGRPLIVALNKWDAVEEKDDCMVDTLAQLRRRLHQLVQPRAMPISAAQALAGQKWAQRGLDDLLNATVEVYTRYHTRIGTAKANRLLAAVLARRSPPLTDAHQSVHLKYATQARTRPPTFAIWGTRVNQLPESYKLFLRNQFAEALKLEDVPIRFLFKQSSNPYASRKRNFFTAHKTYRTK